GADCSAPSFASCTTSSTAASSPPSSARARLASQTLSLSSRSTVGVASCAIAGDHPAAAETGSGRLFFFRSVAEVELEPVRRGDPLRRARVELERLQLELEVPQRRVVRDLRVQRVT